MRAYVFQNVQPNNPSRQAAFSLAKTAGIENLLQPGLVKEMPARVSTDADRQRLHRG